MVPSSARSGTVTLVVATVSELGMFELKFDKPNGVTISSEISKERREILQEWTYRRQEQSSLRIL